jgi:hypothetical protein
MWTSELCLLFLVFAAIVLALPSSPLPTWAAPKRTVAQRTASTRTLRTGGAVTAGLESSECAPLTLDLEPEIRSAVAAMDGLARDYFVRLTIAVSPLSVARINPIVLRKVLRAAISTAINAQFGGRVLVTVTKSGDEQLIRIVDEAIDADAARRKGLLWEQAELLSSQHGAIDVETVPGGGTAITISLPAAIQQPGTRGALALAEHEA